jgi:phosphoribosylaminoimidazole carboxylase (NCAIR synthetase)
MRVWTFTTTAHAAHPSATCRTVADVHGQTTLDQQIDCRSTRENCDALYREFEELNARMRRELERAARAEHPAG